MSTKINLSLLTTIVLFSISVWVIFPDRVSAQVLTADANGDYQVTGIDYTTWLINFGRTVTTGNSQGDYNGDGTVSGPDYVVWLNNYGTKGQGAYKRTSPWPILTKIQAEDYDAGSTGLNYYDTTAGNIGNSTYRTEGVDLRDYSGAIVIGHTEVSEWVEYTIDNPTTQTYNLSVNAGTVYDGKTVTFTWNDVQIAQATVPNTGVWGNQQTVTVQTSQIPAGRGILRMTFNSDFANVDWFEFTNFVPPTITPSPTPVAIYPKILSSTGAGVRFIETQAPQAGKVFIKAEVIDPAITDEVRLDWSVDGGTTWVKEYNDPFYIGSDTSGVPTGYVLPSSTTTFTTRFYYNAYNSYLGSTLVYSSTGVNPTSTPIPSTNPTPTPTPTVPPTTNPGATATPTTDKLTWSKPTLTNPGIVNVTTGTGNLSLDPQRDYIINMPSTAYPRPLYIVGGRNIHLIGGVISVDADTSSTENAALRIYDSTGIVHVEGLKLTGAYITDGIHTNAPQATVQLQNIYIDPMWQKGDPSGGSHGDCIQTWGGVKELRVDKLTCAGSPYQGLYLQANYNKPHGNVTLKRTNIIGTTASRYLFWITSDSYDSSKTITLDNVWVDNPNRTLSNTVCYYYNSVCPNGQVTGTDSLGQYVTWPNETVPRVVGKVYEGRPSSNFVSPTTVGFGYTSPGYQ